MKIVILGGAGMLGHKMFQTLSASFPETYCTIRGRRNEPPVDRIELLQSDKVIENVDVMDLPALHATLAELKPDAIINCIGVIKQRDTAKVALPSITINSLLPHALAEWASEWGGRVIHFSTDCVFSGHKGMYSETDPSDAEDLYGKSKFLGEVAADNALTLRTSIVGRELSHFKSLLDWFLSQEGKKIQGWRKAIYSGVTTNHLAELVTKILKEHPDLHGLYQVASEPITKLDLLLKFRDAFGANVEIDAVDGEDLDRSMTSERLKDRIGYVAPSWDEMVAQVASDPTPYSAWRSPSKP
jgi:dTDP-4-dehydrorhamnose reductase